jgi:glc operon protein GlcG
LGRLANFDNVSGMRRLLIALTLTALSVPAFSQLATKKALTLEAAKKIAASAEAEAKKNNWNVVIAILDDGANLVYLQKMDGTQTGSIDIAQGKARTSIRMKRPSKALEDAVTGGRNVVLALPNVVPVDGGLPLVVGGEYIGAIGVSGVTSQQDGQIAAAGVAALAAMK